MVHLHKYNKYLNSYISYSSSENDILSPMFDDKMHFVKDLRNYFVNARRDCVCYDCNTVFSTKKDLVHHLRYMGYDIPFGEKIKENVKINKNIELLRPSKIIQKRKMEDLNKKLHQMSLSADELCEMK